MLIFGVTIYFLFLSYTLLSTSIKLRTSVCKSFYFINNKKSRTLCWFLGWPFTSCSSPTPYYEHPTPSYTTGSKSFWFENVTKSRSLCKIKSLQQWPFLQLEVFYCWIVMHCDHCIFKLFQEERKSELTLLSKDVH